MKLTQTIVNRIIEDELRNRNFSNTTITSYKYALNRFCCFLLLTKRSNDLRQVHKLDILDFEKFLFNKKYLESGKNTFSKETQFRILLNLSLIFKILLKKELIVYSPFECIDISRHKSTSKREGISEVAMFEFLDSIELDGRVKIRDRVMFELLYCTGIRLGELYNLNINDVDLASGRLFIEQGKGKKDRILPLGKNLIKYLEIYLLKSRPKLLTHSLGKERKALFVSWQGKRLGKKAIHRQLKIRLAESGLEIKKLSCHMFRHSFATHLMENDAAVKKVKDLLGHSNLSSTVIYTHFNVGSLKKIIRQFHPGENSLFKELASEEREKFINVLKYPHPRPLSRREKGEFFPQK